MRDLFLVGWGIPLLAKMSDSKPFPPEVLRHFQVIAEIEEQTDRGAALIVAALLEERLSEAIEAALAGVIRDVKADQETVRDRLFGNSRPCGTFSARIDLAFAMGFFGPDSYRDLHLLRKIRNEFAHKVDPTSFESAGIEDRCRELKLPDWMCGGVKPPVKARARFMRSFHILYDLLWTEMVKKKLVGEGRGPDPAPYALP